MSTFVGRQEALALIDSLWNSPKSNFLILYGRRRVGKTRLLTYWLKRHKKHGLYWVAEPTSALDQLRSFSQALYNFSTPNGTPPAPQEFTYASWEQALLHVAAIAQERRIALILDEFTYLMDVQPDIAGTLQKVWDQALGEANLFLVLSGSQMGMMQKQLLSYQAPLYGRSTAQVKLPPLPYGVTKEYFPGYSAAERVALYSVWGGVPAYWERINTQVSILQNIRSQSLAVNAQMQEEPRTLLQDFINDPHNYVGIMRGIAHGARTPARISTFTGLPPGHMSRYLAVLQDTGFVARFVPLTEMKINSRRGRYYIVDPFLRFYYHFVAAFQAKLALGEQEEIVQAVEDGLPQFIEENTWPELCREWLLRANAQGKFPVSIEETGATWIRHQIFDVVGIDKVKKNLVIGACLWRDEPAGPHVIKELAEKTSAIVPTKGNWSVYYIGFAKNGWQSGATRSAEQAVRQYSGKNWQAKGVYLYELKDVDNDLVSWHENKALQPITA